MHCTCTTLAALYVTILHIIYYTLCLTTAYVKEKGVEEVKADDIVRAIKPRGRQRVPDHIKAELLGQLRKFIVAGT